MVAKYNETSESQIEEIFEEAGIKCLKRDDSIYKLAGLNPKGLNTSMVQLLSATAKKTNNNLSNLTMTTANTSQHQFINAMNKAYMEVSTGTKSYSQSIIDVIKEISDEGAYIEYPSGKHRSLESAVRTNVLTSVNQTTGKLQLLRADEMNCDLMEISAHSGARPEHAEWQGKVVSRSGKKGYLSLDDIGYGDVTGFQGVNCRHTWFPYYEGETLTYTDKELEELNNETVTYNNKKINKYDASQIQRKMERQIRKDKKDIAGLEGILLSNNDEELINETRKKLIDVKNKLNQDNTLLNDFVTQTGFKKDNVRLVVGNNIKFFEQDKSKRKAMMNFQENIEILKSTKIKPSLYSDLNRKNNIEKYENKIWNLYKKNQKENMAMLDKKTGKLIGDICTGSKNGVSPNIKTLFKMINSKENTLIAIHNHPENYSFSHTDINAFNNWKCIDTMIVKSEDYTFYLSLGDGSRKIDKKGMMEVYKILEKKTKKEYSKFNEAEIRDIINQRFAKKMGWIYEREKNKK